MDTSERNGELVRLRLVLPEDGLMVITDGGQVIRTRIEEIRETGRNTQGVRVIRLKDGERVVDLEPLRRRRRTTWTKRAALEGATEGDAVDGAEATEATAQPGAEDESEPDA